MRVLFSEPPQEVLDLLDRRRRWGADRWDEMWNGVLHVIPMPSGSMQRFNTEFLATVAPLAEVRGLKPYYTLGLFRTDDDYRVPRQLYCRPDQVQERGAEGAELVLEIRFDGDEIYEKIDFYSERGVREMLVAHPEEGRIELFRAVGGRLVPARPGPDGTPPRSSGSPSARSTASWRPPGTAGPPPSERAAKPGCGPGIGWSA